MIELVIILFLTFCYIYFNRIKILLKILTSIIKRYFYKPNTYIKNDKVYIKCSFPDGFEKELILPIYYLPYNFNVEIFDENKDHVSIISLRQDSKHHVIGIPEYTNKKLHVNIHPYPDTGESSNVKNTTIEKNTFITWDDVIKNVQEDESELMEAYD